MRTERVRGPSFLPWQALGSAIALCCIILPVVSQTAFNPSTSAPFLEVIGDLNPIREYTFGTSHGRSVTNIAQLAQDFSPYGIAGKKAFNGEWDRYQPFNDQNFVFKVKSLALTATIPQGGGLFNGGINSGQICSKQTFQPGVTGHSIYAFEVRMKVPDGPGMWPAAWFYTKDPGKNDDSEIDNPEFYGMKHQNQYDWTGFQHGPGQGRELYSIKTNKWAWHPGLNFATDFHSYQTLWTPNAVFKYVDGKLIYAQAFKWTASGAAQLLVTLAIGSSMSDKLPGLQPTSLTQFPSSLELEHIKIWAK